MKIELALWNKFKRWKSKALEMKTLLSRAELLGVPIRDDTTVDNADERIMEIRKEIQKKFQDRATVRNNELLKAANVVADSGEKEKLKAL